MRVALALLGGLLLWPGSVVAEDPYLRFLKVRLMGGWGNFDIPSRSMAPNLVPGDQVAAEPFRPGDRLERGDIVVFRRDGVDWIKRVIGLPGERVAVVAGVVTIDGTALAQEPLGTYVVPYQARGWLKVLPVCANDPVQLGGDCEKQRLTEETPEGRRYDVLNVRDDSTFDDMEPVDVPQGGVFVMGDNRDNSMDSRATRQMGGIGMVPIAEIRYRGGFIYSPGAEAPEPRPDDF